jgi:hypothetical protein
MIWFFKRYESRASRLKRCGSHPVRITLILDNIPIKLNTDGDVKMSDNVEEIKAESLKWQKMANDLLEDLAKCAKQELEWLEVIRAKQAEIDKLVAENKRLLDVAGRINAIARKQDAVIENHLEVLDRLHDYFDSRADYQTNEYGEQIHNEEAMLMCMIEELLPKETLQ